MKILYLHRTQGRGVEGVHINGIVNALRHMGHQVEIVCPINKMESSNKAKNLSLFLKALPEFLFEIFEFFYNFLVFFKIIKKFSESRYDFIYERYAFLGWVGVLAAKMLNVQYILEINYTSYNNLVRKRTKLMLPIVRFFERISLKEADKIFVVSNFLKKQLEKLGISKNKIFLTPNAVDEETFCLIKNDTEIKNKFNFDGKFVIGFVGGFYEWHGVNLLLEAVSRLERKRQNLCLLLIGEGPLRTILEFLSNKILKYTKVIFTGEIEHQALPKYIALMSVCVMPNSNDYGSPMKIFEYMALEKPVIAPRLGPLKDVITDNKDGLLFEPLNISDLSNCLSRVIEDEQLRMRLSINAKNTILKKHLWRHNAEKIINAYKNSV